MQDYEYSVYMPMLACVRHSVHIPSILYHCLRIAIVVDNIYNSSGGQGYVMQTPAGWCIFPALQPSKRTVE